MTSDTSYALVCHTDLFIWFLTVYDTLLSKKKKNMDRKKTEAAILKLESLPAQQIQVEF